MQQGVTQETDFSGPAGGGGHRETLFLQRYRAWQEILTVQTQGGFKQRHRRIGWRTVSDARRDEQSSAKGRGQGSSLQAVR